MEAMTGFFALAIVELSDVVSPMRSDGAMRRALTFQKGNRSS